MKSALPYLNKRNRKIILNAKLRGQVSLILPLIINQNAHTQRRMEVLLMRINKWIYGGPTYKRSNKAICKEIGIPEPEQEILKANSKFIHKLINKKSRMTTHAHIVIPKRKTSILYHRKPKKKLYRTALEHHIEIYNQLDDDLKPMNPRQFGRKVKTRKVEYTPKDWLYKLRYTTIITVKLNSSQSSTKMIYYGS